MKILVISIFVGSKSKNKFFNGNLFGDKFYFCRKNEFKMKIFRLILFTLICLFNISLLNAQARSKAYDDYILKYAQFAVIQQNEYGIPASITLAQGLLESGAGLSELALESNNHFGIKCHDWTGEAVYHDDDAKSECFRKYKNVLESYEDHSQFLKNRKRYAFLFDLKNTDYENWAHGLKKAGYATDPTYAYKLISVIENYNLHQYDLGIAAKNNQNLTVNRNQQVNTAQNQPSMGTVTAYVEHQVYKTNGVKFVVSSPGDTWGSIADEFNISEKRLRGYNDIGTNDILQPGVQVYLHKKKLKAARGRTTTRTPRALATRSRRSRPEPPTGSGPSSTSCGSSSLRRAAA